jgi:subtilisin family serine protease
MKLKHTIIALAVASVFSVNALSQTQALNYEAKETTTVLAVGGVPAVWSRGITGKGSIIAIVDQGFDVTQKDFAGKIIASKNFNPTVAAQNPKDPTAITWGYHGTLMAGIAAANADGTGTVGVAPDAKLLLAQVGQGGNSTNVSYPAIKTAIDWASANGATVINLSLGSTFDATFQKGITQLSPSTPGIFQAPKPYTSLYSFNQSDIQAFAVGTNRGSIIVAAAGNQGLPYAQFPGAFATQVDATGKLVLGGRMLIVGATDPTGTVIAPFSNKAGTICNNIVGTTCNDPYLVKDFFVVAPGMQVYGTAAQQLGLGNNGSIAVTGTSPATAYVSGGIALMKQAWPQLKPEQIVSIVLNTAKDLGAKGVDDVYGHGLVDFNAATKPMGTVQLANMTQLTGSGLQGKTVGLVGTGVVTSGAVSLTTSSVLQNTQVVDGTGRNFTANLTQAVGYSNAMSYQYASPWMAMAGANYRQFTTPVGKDSLFTVMSSDYGTATQFEWKHNNTTRLTFEAGALTERNGFLGTQGGGAMTFGNSNTAWIGGGVNYKFADNTALVGNYTLGVTRASNMQDSMVQLGSNIVSDSWKLGVAQDRIFINSGKLKDTFTVAVAQPVQVRSGHATVSGVTSYIYSDNGDGTTNANPVMQTERVSLAPGVREMDLVFGYNISYTNTTNVGINLVRQFNTGGASGVASNGVAIMARSVF